MALRKLLEAKDAAVRANVPPPKDPHAPELKLDEPMETGGHDIDRDGPVPFSG